MKAEDVLSKYNWLLTVQQRNEIKNLKTKNVYYLGKFENISDSESLFGESKSKYSGSLHEIQEK